MPADSLPAEPEGKPTLPNSLLDFSSGSDGKASAYNVGDLGSIPGSGKIPWRRQWQPTPVLLPGKSHGRRSLVSCSLWGHRESDTTERLHFHFNSLFVINIYSGSPGNWVFYLVGFDVDSSAYLPLFAVEYLLLKLTLCGNLAGTSGS